MTITDFLLARIAHDEELARRGTAGEWAPGSGGLYWIADYGGEIGIETARVLAECEAKRRIVALHVEYDDFDDCSTCGDVPQIPHPCDTIKALAAVYADHPDFDEAWR